jgi:formylglycine-generating enzyme
MKKAERTLILISILLLLTSPYAVAEPVVWSNPAGGIWNIAENWTPAKVPLTEDDVIVDLTGDYGISVDSDVTINSLTMDSGDSVLLLNTGTVVIATPDMVLFPAGCFQMGDTFGDGYSDELPLHQVCLSSFAIDRYEATQQKYLAATGTNPSNFSGYDLPVENVSWSDADSYCRGIGKRLPTEAEWEYAARSGGQNQKWAGTSSEPDLGNYAWYHDLYGTTHAVGQKLPNGAGMYDMTGNVWEWVADWYDPGYYAISPVDNPQGPETADFRVIRGGGYSSVSWALRTSVRARVFPESATIDLGFRCAKTP